MVKIRNYKGYEIHYKSDKKRFYAMKKGKIECSNYDTENEVISIIDKRERIKKEIKEKNKKKKELEKIAKGLAKKQIIVNAIEFREFVERVSLIVSQARFVPDKDKLKVIETEPANVAMIDYNCPAKFKGKNIPQMALNTDYLNKILNKTINKNKDKDENITIHFEPIDHKNVEKLLCVINTPRGVFKMRAIELEEKETKVPDLRKYGIVKVNIEKKKFDRIIELCSLVGESCTFETNKKMFNIMSNYDSDIGQYISEQFKILSKYNAEAKYSVEYLKRIKLDGNLKIVYAQDFPLQVIDENKNRFILAPRVEND